MRSAFAAQAITALGGADSATRVPIESLPPNRKGTFLHPVIVLWTFLRPEYFAVLPASGIPPLDETGVIVPGPEQNIAGIAEWVDLVRARDALPETRAVVRCGDFEECFDVFSDQEPARAGIARVASTVPQAGREADSAADCFLPVHRRSGIGGHFHDPGAGAMGADRLRHPPSWPRPCCRRCRALWVIRSFTVASVDVSLPIGGRALAAKGGKVSTFSHQQHPLATANRMYPMARTAKRWFKSDRGTAAIELEPGTVCVARSTHISR